MDTLNYDVTNIIYNNLSVIDKLNTHHIFNEQKPSQFQISSELIASKDIKGINGLIMRALTTGDYEASVLTCLLVTTKVLKHYKYKPSAPISMIMTKMEQHIRADFKDYDENQLVDRVRRKISILP